MLSLEGTSIRFLKNDSVVVQPDAKGHAPVESELTRIFQCPVNKPDTIVSPSGRTSDSTRKVSASNTFPGASPPLRNAPRIVRLSSSGTKSSIPIPRSASQPAGTSPSQCTPSSGQDENTSPAPRAQSSLGIRPASRIARPDYGKISGHSSSNSNGSNGSGDIEELCATVSRRKQIKVEESSYEVMYDEETLSIYLDTKGISCLYQSLLMIMLEVPISEKRGRLLFELGRLAASALPIRCRFDLSLTCEQESTVWQSKGLVWDSGSKLLAGETSGIWIQVAEVGNDDTGNVSRFPALIPPPLVELEANSQDTTIQNIVKCVEHIDSDGRVTPAARRTVLCLSDELQASACRSPIVPVVAEVEAFEELHKVDTDPVKDATASNEQDILDCPDVIKATFINTPPESPECLAISSKISPPVCPLPGHVSRDSMYDSDSLFTTICKEALADSPEVPIRSSTPVDPDQVTESSTGAIRQSPVSPVASDFSELFETPAAVQQSPRRVQYTTGREELFDLSLNASDLYHPRRQSMYSAQDTSPLANRFSNNNTSSLDGAAITIEETSTSPTPQYASLAKIDYTAASDLDKYPIITSFFIMTFTARFDPEPTQPMMTVNITGPPSTMLMIVRVNDENVSWERLGREHIDEYATRQTVSIPHFGFNIGEAFCLITNCELRDVKQSQLMILPTITICGIEPTKEDILLAKSRCPLYVELDSTSTESWMQPDDHTDPKRYKLIRANVPGRSSKPLKIYLRTLRTLKVKDHLSGNCVSNMRIDITSVDESLRFNTCLQVVREVSKSQSDALLRLALPKHHEINYIFVDGSPATTYLGIDGELVILDTKSSSRLSLIEVVILSTTSQIGDEVMLPTIIDYECVNCTVTYDSCKVRQFTNIRPSTKVHVNLSDTNPSTTSLHRRLRSLIVLVLLLAVIGTVEYFDTQSRTARLELLVSRTANLVDGTSGRISELLNLQDSLVAHIEDLQLKLNRARLQTEETKNVQRASQSSLIEDPELLATAIEEVGDEGIMQKKGLDEIKSSLSSLHLPDSLPSPTSPDHLHEQYETRGKRKGLKFDIDGAERAVFRDGLRWIIGVPWMMYRALFR